MLACFSWLVLSCLALPCLVVSYVVLCFVLSCLFVSCLVLFCLTLTLTLTMHYFRLQMLQYFHRVVSKDSLAVSSPSVSFSSEAVSVPFSSEASSVPPVESSAQIVKLNKRKRDSSSFHRLVLDKTGLAIIEAPKKNGRPYSMLRTNHAKHNCKINWTDGFVTVRSAPEKKN